MFSVFCNIFWIVVSAILFLMLIAVICFGYVELKRQVVIDKANNPGKSDVPDAKLDFPAVNRWDMEIAMINARKTDKMIRQYRRNRYIGRR